MTQEDTRPPAPTRPCVCHEVEQLTLPRQHTAVVRARVRMDEIPAFLGQAFEEVASMADSRGVAIVGPPYGRYAFAGEGMEVEAGYPVDRQITSAGHVVASDLPGGAAVCVLHTGSFDQVAEAYEEVERWVHAHGYERACDPWEAYLDVPDGEERDTLVCLPYRLPGEPF